MYIQMNIYRFISVYIYAYVLYSRIWTQTNKCICIFSCTYFYIYVRTYIYKYIYTHDTVHEESDFADPSHPSFPYSIKCMCVCSFVRLRACESVNQNAEGAASLISFRTLLKPLVRTPPPGIGFVSCKYVTFEFQIQRYNFESPLPAMRILFKKKIKFVWRVWYHL